MVHLDGASGAGEGQACVEPRMLKQVRDLNVVDEIRRNPLYAIPAEHHHGHPHHHPAAGSHHTHSHNTATTPPQSPSTYTNLLAHNNAQAATNRRTFTQVGVLMLNVVSSPGSGKTTLLVKTIDRIAGQLPMADRRQSTNRP